jgi:hypothetical protein
MIGAAAHPRTCRRVADSGPLSTVDRLLLPPPSDHLPRCKPDCEQPTGGVRDLLTADVPESASAALGDESAHASYRWLLGHHAAFCVWRLLRETLFELSEIAAPRPELFDSASLLYEAYSVFLLYSGSCSAETYLTAIRPRMVAAHPAFSGRWARDYEAIPGLLRRVKARHPGPAGEELKRAARTSHLVHVAMAAHLVPDGTSLLQESGRSPAHPPTEDERTLLDRFFQVSRTELCRRTVLAQFLRRLTQVVCDLSLSPMPDFGETITRLPSAQSEALSRLGSTSTLTLANLATHLTRELG